MWKTTSRAVMLAATTALLIILAGISYRAAMLASGAILVLALAVATRRMPIIVVLVGMLYVVPFFADADFRFTLVSVILATFGVLLGWWWIDSRRDGVHLREVLLGVSLAVTVSISWFSVTSHRLVPSWGVDRLHVGFNDVATVQASFERELSLHPDLLRGTPTATRFPLADSLFRAQAARGITDREILRRALVDVDGTSRGDPLLFLALSHIARSRIHIDGAREAEFVFTPASLDRHTFRLEGRMDYNCSTSPDPEYCTGKPGEHVYRRTAGPIEVGSVRRGFLLRVARVDSLIGCITRCPPTRIQVLDLPKDAFLEAVYSDKLSRSAFTNTESVVWLNSQPDRAIAFSYIISPWERYRRVLKPFLGLQGVQDWMWALAVLTVAAFLWIGHTFLVPLALEALKPIVTGKTPADPAPVGSPLRFPRFFRGFRRRGRPGPRVPAGDPVEPAAAPSVSPADPTASAQRDRGPG